MGTGELMDLFAEESFHIMSNLNEGLSFSCSSFSLKRSDPWNVCTLSPFAVRDERLLMLFLPLPDHVLSRFDVDSISYLGDRARSFSFPSLLGMSGAMISSVARETFCVLSMHSQMIASACMPMLSNIAICLGLTPSYAVALFFGVSSAAALI